MIYVSLTTIPPRIPALHNTIDSLLQQTVVPDKIILNLPQEYVRFKDPFNLPSFLNHPRIIVNRCTDLGPVTKITGMKELELFAKMTDQDIIIVVDDDRDYHPNMIANFLNYHRKYPDFALTVAAWEVESFVTEGERADKKIPRGVPYKEEGYTDILGGCCGFLITKNQCDTLFSKPEFFDMLNPADSKFYVDDVWISGFLTLHNIVIFMIPSTTGVEEERNHNSIISALFDTTRKQKNRDCILFFRNRYDVW